ncbi:type II secretion system F family protein [Candidatus Hydrogenedentota bacterium]
MEYIDVEKVKVEPKAVELLPENLARKYHILPIRIEGEVLVVAAANPAKARVLERVSGVVGLEIEVCIDPGGELAEAIDYYFLPEHIGKDLPPLERKAEKPISGPPDMLESQSVVVGMESDSYRKVTEFLRQFVTLLEEGKLIVNALSAIAGHARGKGMRSLASDIARHIKAGNPLWQAFARHPRLFSDFFVNLIKASEANGTLVPTLKRFVHYRESRWLFRRRLRGAVLSSVLIPFACCVGLIVVDLLPIPGADEKVMELGWFLTALIPIYPYLCLSVVIISFAWRLCKGNLCLQRDRLKLRIPIFGSIMLNAEIAEFTRTLSLSLGSGVPVPVAVYLAFDNTHNKAVAHELKAACDVLERGERIDEHSRNAQTIISSDVIDMLDEFEESGKLERTAGEIADVYEKNSDNAVLKLSTPLRIAAFLVVLLWVFLNVYARWFARPWFPGS